MLDGGFVKLHRSLLKWEWYDDVNTKVVFLHIILNANYVDKPWHGIIIERGQFVCSYASLAAELKLSVKQVRTALKKLISTGELAHEGHTTYGVITVNNYNKFQDVAPIEAPKGQSEGSQGAVEGQQPKKVKEIQERKRKQEYIPPMAPQGANPALYAPENENNLQAESLTVEMAQASGKPPVEHSTTLASRFEIFWKAYPKRVGKGAAERAFLKIKPDQALLNRMIAVIEKAKQSHQWAENEGQFIPNPATWLTQKRWEDEPVEPYQSAKSEQKNRLKNSSIDMDELQSFITSSNTKGGIF